MDNKTTLSYGREDPPSVHRGRWLLWIPLYLIASWFCLSFVISPLESRMRGNPPDGVMVLFYAIGSLTALVVLAVVSQKSERFKRMGDGARTCCVGCVGLLSPLIGYPVAWVMTMI